MQHVERNEPGIQHETAKGGFRAGITDRSMPAARSNHSPCGTMGKLRLGSGCGLAILNLS